jgi:hypothetical protein
MLDVVTSLRLWVVLMVNTAPQDPSLLTGSSTPPNPPGAPRRVGVLPILLAAGVVSAIAGLLSHAAGNNIPAAILTGGGAFGATVGLLLAIAHYALAE